ncbi:DNA ligase 1-like isoform X1 [Maniola hyperantus]|uniref:DNA ligase 1-like isoform X1 n=1 Tax=Aphantopus hyperantus TaxID=2795564 RepID=UPI0021238B76
MATSRLERIGTIFTRSQFLNDSPKNKKVKRQVKTGKEYHDFSEIKPTPKEKINEVDIDACGESRQRTLNVMNRHYTLRKQIDDNFLKDLMEVNTEIEGDHDALKENVQKLERFAGFVMKCMQQTVASNNDHLKSFKEVYATFKKECEELDAVQKDETEKLGAELDEDIKKLKQKLISDTKRSERENLQKSLFQAMENNFE